MKVNHMSTTTSATPAPLLPRIWYDYEVQAWVEDGVYTQCGHPLLLQPECCYAGSHAGETADPSHCLDTEKEVRPT